MTQASEQDPLAGERNDEQCTTDVFKVGTFGNSGIVVTEEGVVVVDTGTGQRSGSRIVKAIRGKTQAPIHTIIYTHGHFDHAFGVRPFLEDAEEKGHPKPRIIAHELVPRRFDRYKELSGQNEHINRIQFAVPKELPVVGREFFYPDITYADAMQFRLGGLTFELYHAMGETDDATWVWVPERKTAIVGDLMVWSCPNIGNPFKVQRYEVEWAEALEAVAGNNPDYMIPGHGPISTGKEDVQQVCLETAKFLRYLHDEVVRLLNEGCWIEEILERVKVPEDLLSKPWLTPRYGHPTFIIHAIHRRYAGWYNGNPAELFPSKSSEIAAEVVELCGVEQLVERAKELKGKGRIQPALHLADFAIKGANDSKRKEALLLKAELLDAKADAEPSFIARNIFRNGANSAREQADSP